MLEKALEEFAHPADAERSIVPCLKWQTKLAATLHSLASHRSTEMALRREARETLNALRKSTSKVHEDHSLNSIVELSAKLRELPANVRLGTAWCDFETSIAVSVSAVLKKELCERVQVWAHEWEVGSQASSIGEATRLLDDTSKLFIPTDERFAKHFKFVYAMTSYCQTWHDKLPIMVYQSDGSLDQDLSEDGTSRLLKLGRDVSVLDVGSLATAATSPAEIMRHVFKEWIEPVARDHHRRIMQDPAK